MNPAFKTRYGQLLRQSSEDIRGDECPGILRSKSLNPTFLLVASSANYQNNGKGWMAIGASGSMIRLQIHRALWIRRHIFPQQKRGRWELTSQRYHSTTKDLNRVTETTSNKMQRLSYLPSFIVVLRSSPRQLCRWTDHPFPVSILNTKTGASAGWPSWGMPIASLHRRLRIEDVSRGVLRWDVLQEHLPSLRRLDIPERQAAFGIPSGCDSRRLPESWLASIVRRWQRPFPPIYCNLSWSAGHWALLKTSIAKKQEENTASEVCSYLRDLFACLRSANNSWSTSIEKLILPHRLGGAVEKVEAQRRRRPLSQHPTNACTVC